MNQINIIQLQNNYPQIAQIAQIKTKNLGNLRNLWMIDCTTFIWFLY